MANTYVLIASNTLGSNTNTVTFSNIPNTYTDLVLRLSLRSTISDYIQSQANLEFNNTTGSATTYSLTFAFGNGSTAASSRYTSDYTLVVGAVGASGTSNTFSNYEVYIPSYTASQNKPVSSFGVIENNETTAGRTRIEAAAQLWRDTSAISTIKVTGGSFNFVTGSSFWLYGIKKD